MSATTLSRGDICILRVVAALSMALTASPSNAAEIAPTIFETVPLAEPQQIDRLAEITNKLQDRRAKEDASQQGRLLRGVHPKSHGCVIPASVAPDGSAPPAYPWADSRASVRTSHGWYDWKMLHAPLPLHRILSRRHI